MGEGFAPGDRLPQHGEFSSLKRSEPPPAHVNGYQVGGDHYQRGGEQHWDFIERNGIGYLEAAATKYLVRHPFKGTQALDLEKAEHYAQKLRDLHVDGRRAQRGTASYRDAAAWAESQQGLDRATRQAITRLLSWQMRYDLDDALALIKQLRSTT